MVPPLFIISVRRSTSIHIAQFAKAKTDQFVSAYSYGYGLLQKMKSMLLKPHEEGWNDNFHFRKNVKIISRKLFTK